MLTSIVSRKFSIHAKGALLASFILVCNLDCSNQPDSLVFTRVPKYGIVDKDGNSIIAPTFNYDLLSIFSEGLAIAVKDNRFGFINAKNEVVIDFQFGKALHFNEGMAAVFQEGKIGFVDKSGNIAIPLEFEEVSSFINGYAAVRRGEKVGYINTENKLVIPHLYDNISFLSEGLVDVEQDGKWGYVDISGNIVIDLIFDKAFPFKDGIAYVGVDDKYGYINKQGEFLIAPELEWVPNAERVIVEELDFWKPQVLAIEVENSASTRPLFSRVKWISDGLIIYKEDDKYGFIDIEGNPRIPAQFTFVLPFSEGQTFISQENTRHLIDTAGEVLRTFDTRIGILNGKYIIKKEKPSNQFWLINADGTTISDRGYDRIFLFEKGYAQVIAEEKWGVINTQGEEVIPPVYDYVSPYSEGFFIIKEKSRRISVRVVRRSGIKVHYSD